MKVHVVYDYIQNCTMNLMVSVVSSSTVSSSTEQKIIWRQIGFPSLRAERPRYYMTELQKCNKNSNLTIEGTCRIWLNVELHEESNDVFSFFIYQTKNNLKTDWISVTQSQDARATIRRKLKDWTKILI